MHALTVRQPYAEQIATGEKTEEYRTWAPRSIIGRDLLIVASKTPEEGGEALPLGVAVCIVRVISIHDEGDTYVWALSDPRRVQNVSIRGSAALYHVRDELIVEVAPEPMPAREARRVLRKAGRAIAKENAKPYTFQQDDRKIRGESAPTMTEARKRARQIADKLEDYVFIMRDGLNVGGEWHAAKRDG